MSLFNRTLDNTKKLTADNIHSDVYSGVVINNIEDYLLSVSYSFGITSSNIINSVNLLGISSANTINSINLLGATTANVITSLNQYEIDTSTSFSNVGILYGTSFSNLDTFKGLVGVSTQNIDSKIGIQLGITNNTFNNSLFLLGASVAVCQSSIGALGTSASNNSQNKADKLLFGVSISNLDSDVSILYNNDQSLSNEIIALGITIGTSSASLDSELNSVYAYLVQQLEGKTDDSTFAALQSAFGALDTAYSVYTVANELWKTSQTTNNGAQQSEIQGLQGQHDSARATSGYIRRKDRDFF